MNIVIDPKAGFCPGVRRAVQKVERMLAEKGEVISAGPLIHNPAELQRLGQRGLITESQERLLAPEHLPSLRRRSVFIRTHGLAAAEMRNLLASGAVVEDGTCPTVHQVQKKIAERDEQGDQIVIVGKKGHAEVAGLVGYGRNCLVIENETDLHQAVLRDRVAFFSQTTFDQKLFQELAKKIQQRVAHATVFDTTCSYINRRRDEMIAFAASVDVFLLVGGAASSNSHILFEACRRVNERSFKIESTKEIEDCWFTASDSVGISGGASTPMEQLEEVKRFLLVLSAQWGQS